MKFLSPLSKVCCRHSPMWSHRTIGTALIVLTSCWHLLKAWKNLYVLPADVSNHYFFPSQKIKKIYITSECSKKMQNILSTMKAFSNRKYLWGNLVKVCFRWTFRWISLSIHVCIIRELPTYLKKELLIWLLSYEIFKYSNYFL